MAAVLDRIAQIRLRQSRTGLSAPCRSTSWTGFGSGLVCAPRHQTISRTPALARIPSVIGGPGADFIAAQMAPMGASRTEKRDILSGEAADVFYR